MSKTRTMAEVRAECQALGITPARSIAESEARIAEHKAKTPQIAPTAEAHVKAWREGVGAGMAKAWRDAPPNMCEQAHRQKRRQMRKATIRAQRRASKGK